MKSIKPIPIVIRRLVKKIIKENDKKPCKCESAYDINNGLCCEFAEELINILFGEETDDHYILSTDMFVQDSYEDLVDLWGADDLLRTEGGGAWSKKMLSIHTTPPVKDIRKIEYLNHHEWVCIDKKYYDAECPEGVNTPWDLPIFQKFFKDYQ